MAPPYPFYPLIDKHRASSMGLTTERLTMLGQKLHAIMIISILPFCSRLLLLRQIFPKSCQRDSRRSLKPHSVKWKQKLNRGSTSILNATPSAHPISLPISHWPMGFSGFTGTQNVSPIYIPIG